MKELFPRADISCVCQHVEKAFSKTFCNKKDPPVYGASHNKIFRLSPLSTSGGEECTICFKEESSFPELSIKCSTHQRHNVCKQCLYTYFKQEIDEGLIIRHILKIITVFRSFTEMYVLFRSYTAIRYSLNSGYVSFSTTVGQIKLYYNIIQDI